MSHLPFVEVLLVIKHISPRAWKLVSPDIFIINEWPSCQHKLPHSPNNCLGLMIFCAFRFSDALFQPCHFLLYIHWGIIGVSLVFWHFGSCLRHTQTTWLRWLKPRPVSKWHFVMPTCHPFSARPTLTLPPPPNPHGPAKGKSYKPNHLHFCPFHWGLHQLFFSSYPSNILCCTYTGAAEEDELFCTYGRDDSWCLLQFSAASPGQHSSHSTARTVATFFSSDDVPACDRPDSGVGVSTQTPKVKALKIWASLQCHEVESGSIMSIVESGGVHTRNTPLFCWQLLSVFLRR